MSSSELPDRGDAEDILTEVFAAAAVALARRCGDRSLHAWLLGIARQKVAEAA